VKIAAKIESASRRKVSFKPSDISRRVGANIKSLRDGKIGKDNKPLTQGEMARDLWGAQYSYVAKIEAGNSNISLLKLIQIAEYLGLGEKVYRLFLKPDTIIVKE
jgi:transcriptional regulator with XRE-family HTH domain